MVRVNSTTPSFLDKATDFAQQVSHKLSRTFTQIDGMDKFMKCANSISDVYTYFYSNESLSIMNSQFKGATNMFGALNSVNRIKEWVVADERQKFITDAKKTAMKVLFTASNFLESIKYGDVLKFYDLGFVGVTKVFIPVLERAVEFSPIAVAKDLTAMTAMVINLTDADKIVREGRLNARNAEIDLERYYKTNLKKRTAKALSEEEQRGNLQASIDELSKVDNVSRLEYIGRKKEIAALRGKPVNGNFDEVAGRKWVNFLNNQAKLNKANQYGEGVEEFWRIAYDLHSTNWIKAALSITSDLSKVVIISTAIVGLTILGIKAAAFMVPFLLGAAACGAIGYVKFLFDDWYKQREAAWSAASVAGLTPKGVGTKY